MPRDGTGNYSLPGAINPVTPGSTITAAWANTTMQDIGAALTASFCRDGSAAMTGPFYATSGGVSAPGYSFSSEHGLGIYRSNLNEMSFAADGATIARLSSSSAEVNAPAGALTLTASTTATLAGSDVTLDATDDVTVASGDAMTLTADGALLVNANSGLTVKQDGTTLMTLDTTNGVQFPIGSIGGLLAVTVKTSGSGTHTLNSKTGIIVAEVWGGGGGGGGASAASGNIAHGNSGGGGAYSIGIKFSTASSVTWGVGSGGSAGSSGGGNGGAGGDSYVNQTSAIASADGGAGGTGNVDSVVVASGGHDAGGVTAGGASGTATILFIPGGTSKSSTIYASGGIATFSTGVGGNSPRGGMGGVGTGIGTNGNAGGSPGGGGGGAISYNGTGRAGGAGAAGKVIIWEYSK